MLRLDLGAGAVREEGWTAVDLRAPKADRVDLLKFPWPWADESVDEARAIHFVEHVPAREVQPRDLTYWEVMASGKKGADDVAYVGRDMLCVFFDECWRVLKPGGKLTVVCPHARSHAAFQDPTHRRYIVEETFNYLNQEWRVKMGVDHYTARCNFDVWVVLRAAESKRQRVAALGVEVDERWNLVDEIHAELIKRPLAAVYARSEK